MNAMSLWVPETRCVACELGLLIRSGWRDHYGGVASARWAGAAGPFGCGEGDGDPRYSPSARSVGPAGGAAAVDVGGQGGDRGVGAAASAGAASGNAGDRRRRSRVGAVAWWPDAGRPTRDGALVVRRSRPGGGRW